MKPRPWAMSRSRCVRPDRSPVRAVRSLSRAGRSRSSNIRPVPRAGAPMSIEPPGVAQPKLSAAAGARRAAVQSAGAAGLAARRRSAGLQSRTETPFRCAGRGDRNRRAAALCAARRRTDRAAAIRATDAPGFAAARPAAQSAACARDADRGETSGDAGVPDRVGARSLVRQLGATGGAASGSISRWSRSSRSRPIPAAA